MLKHDEVLVKRRKRTTSARPTDWGWINRVAKADDYEVFVEVVGAGARKGVTLSEIGQLTVVVLNGVLWIKDDEPPSTRRLTAGQAYVSQPGRRFEIATGASDAQLLVVKPTGLKMERIPGTGNRLAGRNMAPASRRAQRSPEERVAMANAALGLGRVQPLPSQVRTAAEVSFGFNQHGVNLAPVVPEP